MVKFLVGNENTTTATATQCDIMRTCFLSFRIWIVGGRATLLIGKIKEDRLACFNSFMPINAEPDL